MRPPRKAYAHKTKSLRIGTPRILPIIVVPGVMGSRLSDPKTGDLVWNPKGSPLGDDDMDQSPGLFTADYQRLAQMSYELEPAEHSKYPGDNEENRQLVEEEIDGYYGLIPEYYGKLPQRLAWELDARTFPVAVRVYCCGYDWRQDNAKSALRLAAKVDRALRETGERKVIIVAHSMGGLVARYFCRVLGGEQKVHRLILLASPTLGAVEGYTIVKSGLTGLYLDDFSDQIDTFGAIWDTWSEDWEDRTDAERTAAVAEGFTEIAAADVTRPGWLHVRADIDDPVNWALGILTLPYAALSLHKLLRTGNVVSRMEAMLFARALTSVYQLMPNRVFCRDYRQWLLFDPMQTGYPPNGFLLDLARRMPPAPEPKSLFIRTLALAWEIVDPVDDDPDFDWSARATNNYATGGDYLARMGELIEEYFGAPAETRPLFLALRMLVELYETANRGFLDNRNRHDVYRDIYTGLLDIPGLRGLCAANIALAERFDDALTVSPRETPSRPPLGILSGMVDAIWGALKAIVTTDTMWEAAKRNFEARFDPEEDAEDGAKATVYMHPNTVCLYCDDLKTVGHAAVVPQRARSNDDHNVVYQLLITEPPDPPALPGDGGRNTSMGDETVPGPSGFPLPEQLSNPFVATAAMSECEHGKFSIQKKVVDYVIDDIAADLPEFLKT